MSGCAAYLPPGEAKRPRRCKLTRERGLGGFSMALGWRAEECRLQLFVSTLLMRTIYVVRGLWFRITTFLRYRGHDDHHRHQHHYHHHQHHHRQQQHQQQRHHDPGRHQHRQHLIVAGVCLPTALAALLHTEEAAGSRTLRRWA